MSIDSNEQFSKEQLEILKRYVSNCGGNVFVLRNLPEVIKGALFSRYSRSSLGLRELLIKEFILNDKEAGFSAIAPSADENSAALKEQNLAIQKAQKFYDRILDGYGDDSIGELGGAHLAIENVSIIAAKAIEDCRIGGSPLEKSTRYIYFDQKVNGEYRFYREPVLMTSAYRDVYLNTCNMLFDTYSQLIPPLTQYFEEKNVRDPAVSNAAYSASLRAKVLDCLRGLLPASTLTNMGVYGNGRFFDGLIHKLHCSNLVELEEIGKNAFEELAKVIPSFIRRADLTHYTHQQYATFHDAMRAEIIAMAAQQPALSEPRFEGPSVKLIESDVDAVYKVAAALLYPHCHNGLEEITRLCKSLPDEDLARILDAGSNARDNRRHKSPRALEHANFTFEIVADYGVYRDLHRHRLLTQERQLLNCNHGYHTPPDLIGTPFEAPYVKAMEEAKEVFDAIVAELAEEAQYIVPMAYNVRWYFHVNLRALQWICELRSQAAGHYNYRHIAQSMAAEIFRAYPAFERFFKFVDFEGCALGRLHQEQSKYDKITRE